LKINFKLFLLFAKCLRRLTDVTNQKEKRYQIIEIFVTSK